eukprot:9662863-Ditylum_brightwellii.AAC.1
MYTDGISRPAYINGGSPIAGFEPSIDATDQYFAPMKTSYKVTLDEEYGKKDEREPTAEILMQKYFP